MQIRKLTWVKTYDNIINGGRIHLEDWKSEGKYGQNYHVGSTVSKKIFYKCPYFSQERESGVFYINYFRKQCPSIEEGKRLCEEHWENFVKELIEDHIKPEQVR